MKEIKAYTLAIETIDKEIRRLAVDANLFDGFGARFAAAAKASLRRWDLREARALLIKLKEGSRDPP